jgi:hypothetical protein
MNRMNGILHPALHQLNNFARSDDLHPLSKRQYTRDQNNPRHNYRFHKGVGMMSSTSNEVSSSHIRAAVYSHIVDDVTLDAMQRDERVGMMKE